MLPANPNTIEGKALILKRKEDQKRKLAGDICLNTYATVEQQLQNWQGRVLKLTIVV